MIEIDYNLERDLGSRREIYNADLFKNKSFLEFKVICFSSFFNFEIPNLDQLGKRIFLNS